MSVVTSFVAWYEHETFIQVVNEYYGIVLITNCAHPFKMFQNNPLM